MTDDAIIARAKQVFAVEIEGLKKTSDSLDASFVSAIRMMLSLTFSPISTRRRCP